MSNGGAVAVGASSDPDYAFTIPPGTYRVRLVMLFPTFPAYPGVSVDVRDEIARLAADPVPLWTGGALRSAPVEITIASEPRLSN